jgi:predicted RNA-binding protein
VAKQNGAVIPTLTDETIRNLIANQATELQLRSQELVVEKEALLHNRDLALQSIAAQKEDRSDARTHQRTIQRDRFVFGTAVIFLAVASVCVLAWLGKDELAKECVKLAAYMGAGILGGYAFGSRKANQKNDSSQDDDS